MELSIMFYNLAPNIFVFLTLDQEEREMRVIMKMVVEGKEEI